MRIFSFRFSYFPFSDSRPTNHLYSNVWHGVCIFSIFYSIFASILICFAQCECIKCFQPKEWEKQRIGAKCCRKENWKMALSFFSIIIHAESCTLHAHNAHSTCIQKTVPVCVCLWRVKEIINVGWRMLHTNFHKRWTRQRKPTEQKWEEKKLRKATNTNNSVKLWNCFLCSSLSTTYLLLFPNLFFLFRVYGSMMMKIVEWILQSPFFAVFLSHSFFPLTPIKVELWNLKYQNVTR